MANSFPSFPDGCKSLLCRYLTKEVFDSLKNKQTTNNFTLMQAIHSGIANPDSSIGAYVGDKESYTLFAPLFDPIIQAYHGFSKSEQHKSDLNPNHLNAPNPDAEGKYIISTRIRVGRNLADYPLGPAISREQRNEVESLVKEALQNLTGNLSGKYYSLQSLSAAEKEQLIADHYLFKSGDRFLEAAGLNRDWPEGRGIYHNDEKNFLVWVNEEDHLRIICMQAGGDIHAVFARLCTAVKHIEEQLTFSYSDHLGNITSCPTNLGTAMRASVHIKLPNPSRDIDKLQNIAEQHHLQIRGIHGEHSESEGGIYDLSNMRRLGITEVACVQDLYDGVATLINALS